MKKKTRKEKTSKKQVLYGQDLKTFKCQLESEKKRLMEELKLVDREKPDMRSEERTVPLSSDDDITDTASVLTEMGTIRAEEENLQKMLQQVNLALEKVKKKTYGMCDSCGKPIGIARLKALPFATLCIGCKSRQEHLNL